MTHKDVSVRHGNDGVIYTNTYADNRDPSLDPIPCHTSGCEVCLLKDIRLLLNKLVDRSPPYHSGPTAVSLPFPTPKSPYSDSKAPQSDDSVS